MIELDVSDASPKQRRSQVDFEKVAGFATPAPPRGPPPMLGVELPALRELIQTEAAYVADLDLLCDAWLKPMRELRVLPNADERALFSNCETLRGINAELLRGLLADKTPAGAAAGVGVLTAAYNAKKCQEWL